MKKKLSKNQNKKMILKVYWKMLKKMMIKIHYTDSISKRRVSNLILFYIFILIIKSSNQILKFYSIAFYPIFTYKIAK